MNKIILLLLLSFCLISCDQKSQQQSSSSQKPSHPQTPRSITFSNFSMQIPTSWKEVATRSPQRIVEFLLLKNRPFRVLGFYFGPTGNMSPEEIRQKNLSRWEKQFTTLTHQEKIEVEKEGISLFLLKGTFMKRPFPNSQEGIPLENYGMLGAIVPSDDGPYFFKLVAPAAVVERERENFKSFLNSYDTVFAAKEPPALPSSVVNNQKSTSEKIQYADFLLMLPEDWQQQEASSQMRLVELPIANTSYQVIGYHFGKPANLSEQEIIKENLDRWIKQFSEISEQKEIELEKEQLKLHYIEGTIIKKPFPMAREGVPTPGYAILVAIVPSSKGPYYFRLEAPKEIVQAQQGNFVSFLNSYQKVAK